MSNNLQPRSIMHKISKMGSSTKSNSPISLKKKLSDNTTGSVTDHESCCSSVSFDEHEPRQGFETLNQNEFVDRVLIDGCNDLDMIVHFYNEDTTFSFHIEEKLLKIVQQPSRCDFVLYRIDASMAPYFTSKLQIDASKTTVLRFKNGHVLGKKSDFDSGSCYTSLQRWLKTTDVNDDFASLELQCE